MTLKRKVIIIFTLCLTLILAGSFIFSKRNRLTVTHVHDNIYFNQTTVTELVALYGEPEFIEEDVDKVTEKYRENNGAEVSISEKLADYTDYWITLKGRKENYSKQGNYHDYYYEYRGNNLGLEYVRFYIKDGYIRSHFYGEITNPLVARQDKYLRQVLEEGTSKN